MEGLELYHPKMDLNTKKQRSPSGPTPNLADKILDSQGSKTFDLIRTTRDSDFISSIKEWPQEKHFPIAQKLSQIYPDLCMGSRTRLKSVYLLRNATADAKPILVQSLKGQIMKLAKNKTGSEYLQEILETADKDTFPANLQLWLNEEIERLTPKVAFKWPEMRDIAEELYAAGLMNEKLIAQCTQHIGGSAKPPFEPQYKFLKRMMKCGSAVDQKTLIGKIISQGGILYELERHCSFKSVAVTLEKAEEPARREVGRVLEGIFASDFNRVRFLKQKTSIDILLLARKRCPEFKE